MRNISYENRFFNNSVFDNFKVEINNFCNGVTKFETSPVVFYEPGVEVSLYNEANCILKISNGNSWIVTNAVIEANSSNKEIGTFKYDNWAKGKKQILELNRRYFLESGKEQTLEIFLQDFNDYHIEFSNKSNSKLYKTEVIRTVPHSLILIGKYSIYSIIALLFLFALSHLFKNIQKFKGDQKINSIKNVKWYSFIECFFILSYLFLFIVFTWGLLYYIPTVLFALLCLGHILYIRIFYITKRYNLYPKDLIS